MANHEAVATKPVAADFWDGVDPEIAQFEQDLLESMAQAQRGEYAQVHTPQTIEARRRGRPRGSTTANPKVQTTIRFEADVLAALKASGKGWQTRVNDTMREWLRTHPV